MISMDDQKLEALFRDLESDRVERKASDAAYEQTNAPVKVYWFNDRIEMQNPGGLFGQVNRENFGKGATDYRNPHLAGVMKDLGYVQRFGYGIPTAKRALERNGNPPPDFYLEDAYTTVIVRRAG